MCCLELRCDVSVLQGAVTMKLDQYSVSSRLKAFPQALISPRLAASPIGSGSSTGALLEARSSELIGALSIRQSASAPITDITAPIAKAITNEPVVSTT